MIWRLEPVGLSCQHRITILALCCATLIGCSASSVSDSRPKLADLPAFDRSIVAVLPDVNEQQLDALYQQILQLQPAAQTRQKILYRLSQMHTSQFERQDLAPEQEQAALQQLVQRYQQLLNDYPQDPNNELIRYQLARSYDLLGQQQACLEQLDQLLQHYPDSGFASEAWFRKGDIHYSRSEYPAALAAYLAVINGQELTLKQHARYMAGWSYFKQQQFELADEQFLAVLDTSYSEIHTDEQDPGVQGLRAEVLRTLSVSLSYQEQAQSLQSLLQRVSYRSGERPVALVAEVYQALANFLAEKALHNARLQTYRLFITDYPESILAARFQLTVIQHYLSDANAQQALAEQQQYLQLFGPESAFWQQAKVAELTEVEPNLLQYYDYFARAQYAKALTLASEPRQAAFAAVIPLWQQMLSVLGEPLLQHSPQQATYSAADIRYLLAESYAGALDSAAALKLYTQLGYGAEPENASLFTTESAAYKALLISAELAEHDETSARQHWQQQTDFVQHHRSHPAAQQVALQQLQQRYNEQDYFAVLQHSDEVIAWPLADKSQPALVQEARFLHSQSELALTHYAAAEQSIQTLLNDALSPARRNLLTEQLASSIYQQAQQADVSSEVVQGHLQRLLSTLSTSAYHEAAAFQQIEIIRQALDYTSAIPLLTAFIQRYPDSERTRAAKAQLLDSYEQAGQWSNAARELTTLAATSTDTEQQREALYLAAQYFQKAGENNNALDAWRSYANRYQQPHLLAQEARLQLIQLYQAEQDVYRQNFWRSKIASFEQQFSSEGNERTQQLAAQALLELGRHESELFNGIRLAHPLKQSLQKKRQHMTAAISHFEQSMQYGVAALLTEAQFRVAELYQQMAKALLASDRPKGLDELALEEYELLLEEQAYPFEEQAIAIYQQNTQLTQQQLWDQWVQHSFSRLAQLLPAKFDKTETYTEVANEVF
ncbi:hypothetical protein ORJ00_14505 [Rheinheimera baltica]|uniref:tetratricopeptide repeat protein n=1 Tax=Rheinheimera baltica TaxID=67576 RepID=UPI00273EFF64|nr:tetratricopeptide repeat protein [Rheinheimera baltica]MDP5143956.1 hypothetical protein [Rheinheimera baltica]